MKRPLLLGAGLLSFMALILWLLREPDAPTSDSGPRTDAQAEDLSARLRARLEQGASREELAADGSLELRGRVLDPNGAPVGGALLTVTSLPTGTPLAELSCGCADHCSPHLLDGSCPEAPTQLLALVAERHGEAQTLARTTSAADGTFTLRGLEAQRYRIWADSEQGIGSSELSGEQGSVELTLEKGWMLSGKVVDEDDKPLGGAVVNAVDSTHGRYYDVLSAADGTFSVGPVLAIRHLVVASSGALIPNAELLAPDSDDDERTLDLETPRRLTGRVLRGESPVANATVALDGLHRADKVSTGEDGSFTFERLRAGRYTVNVSEGSDTGVASAMVSKKKATEPLVVRLERGGVLIVSVVDQDGNPVAGAELTATVEAAGADPEQHGTTDASGSFRFDPIGAGQVVLWAKAEGFIQYTGRTTALVTVGQEQQVELKLDRGAPVSGVVVDSSGAPIEGVKLVAVTEEHGAEDATTKKDGAFRLTGWPGPVRLRATHDEYLPYRSEVTAPVSSLRVVMDRGLVLRGRVIDETGAPRGGARVMALAPGKEKDEDGERDYERTGKSLEDGSFTLKGLIPGAVVVVAMTEEGTGEDKTMRVGGEKATLPFDGLVTVQLQSGEAIRGVVVDQNGKPAPKVRVFAKLEGLDEKTPPVDEIVTLLKGGAPFGQGISGEDGRFELKNLRAGRFELTTHGGEYRGLEAKASAGDTDVRLVVRRFPRISGRVLGEDGRPLGRFKVNEESFDSEDGRFSLSSRGRAKVDVTVREPGYATWQKPVKVGTADVELGDVRLTRGATIAGKVIDRATRAPIPGALVDLVSTTTATGSQARYYTPSVDRGAVRTGADGRFERRNFEVGAGATVIVSHPDYAKVTSAVAPGTPELVLEMGKAALIRGRLVTQGAKVEHAVVRATDAAGEVRSYAPADPKNAFELRDLPGGSYRISVTGSPPFVPAEVSVVDGEISTVELQQRTGGSDVTLRVEGVSRRFHAALIPGEVALPRDVVAMRQRMQGGLDASWVDEGTVSVQAVPAGRYTALVIATEEGQVRGLAQRVEISGAGAETVTLRFGSDAVVLLEPE